jgi:hypothetical protein
MQLVPPTGVVSITTLHLVKTGFEIGNESPWAFGKQRVLAASVIAKLIVGLAGIRVAARSGICGCNWQYFVIR